MLKRKITDMPKNVTDWTKILAGEIFGKGALTKTSNKRIIIIIEEEVCF